MSYRPLIGIVCNHCFSKNNTYSYIGIPSDLFHILASYDAYIIPIAMNHSLDDYIHRIDGLILTGGGYDMPPESYDSLKRHKTISTNDTHSHYELELTKAFLGTKKPILAVGAGEELLTVALGGNIVQDITSDCNSKTSLNHIQVNDLSSPSHQVLVKDKSLLHRITKQHILQVNSNHHQATKDVPEDVLINATAPDGIIEGIELPHHPFCLGVVWHPELTKSPEDKAIFEAFIHATK